MCLWWGKYFTQTYVIYADLLSSIEDAKLKIPVFDHTLLCSAQMRHLLKVPGSYAHAHRHMYYWIIHCLSTCIILLLYICRRGMDDYHTQTCSYPDCCKNIIISEPEIFNVTRIELNSCSILLNEEQNYRITSTKGTSWTLRSKKCCYGFIYVYFGKYHLHSCGNVIHIFSLYLIYSTDIPWGSELE